MCIFARCLKDVLDAHGKTIGSLYTVLVNARPISPVQIIRLRRASEGDCALSVTLNPEQLEAVRDKFGFDPEEIRQLKTALLAESQFRLLLDRVSPFHAKQIADGIFHLLLDASDDTLNAYGLDFDIVREGIDEVDDIDNMLSEDTSPPIPLLWQQAQDALEPAVQAYEEAELWLDRARMVNQPSRRKSYAGLASSLLAFAAESLDSLRLTEAPAALCDEWMLLIERAQGEAVRLAALGS